MRVDFCLLPLQPMPDVKARQRDLGGEGSKFELTCMITCSNVATS